MACGLGLAQNLAPSLIPGAVLQHSNLTACLVTCHAPCCSTRLAGVLVEGLLCGGLVCKGLPSRCLITALDLRGWVHEGKQHKLGGAVTGKYQNALCISGAQRQRKAQLDPSTTTAQTHR